MIGNGKCGYCGERYGSHSVSCPVKFRDVNGTPPNVQEQHELLDEYYKEADDYKSEATAEARPNEE